VTAPVKVCAIRPPENEIVSVTASNISFVEIVLLLFIWQLLRIIVGSGQ
jgi:hypothetical protein